MEEKINFTDQLEEYGIPLEGNFTTPIQVSKNYPNLKVSSFKVPEEHQLSLATQAGNIGHSLQLKFCVEYDDDAQGKYGDDCDYLRILIFPWYVKPDEPITEVHHFTVLDTEDSIVNGNLLICGKDKYLPTTNHHGSGFFNLRDEMGLFAMNLSMQLFCEGFDGEC